ncbi:MAG TPA: hypothetical protein VLE91_03020 [Candidatus Saccharimonadales bacterium]|nr:hypothetical protein [Candidatus Saccharimonadales bacterium]
MFGERNYYTFLEPSRFKAERPSTLGTFLRTAVIALPVGIFAAIALRAYSNKVTPDLGGELSNVGVERGTLYFFQTKELVDGQGVPVFDPKNHKIQIGWTNPGVLAAGTPSKDDSFRFPFTIE